jgi:TrmH RNA methyltransferase
MRNRLTNELAVCGYNATKALADVHPERINRLFLREELLRDFGKACKLLAGGEAAVQDLRRTTSWSACARAPPQGVVAMIAEPEFPFLTEEILKAWGRRGESVLILDDVGNDNNLGAIVRSAAFFGVKHLVVSAEDGAARLTTSAFRVAEGGMEKVEFHCVKNMASFIRAASRELVVVGADHRAGQSCGNCRSWSPKRGSA